VKGARCPDDSCCALVDVQNLEYLSLGLGIASLLVFLVGHSMWFLLPRTLDVLQEESMLGAALHRLGEEDVARTFPNDSDNVDRWNITLTPKPRQAVVTDRHGWKGQHRDRAGSQSVELLL